MSDYVQRRSARELTVCRRAAGASLRHLDLELTERCNNDCIHCYINRPGGDSAARERELTTDEVAHVLEEAAGLGALSVRFTGGEPLLREDFAEIYLAARGLGMRVALFTNATLLTPAIADLLARVPPLEPVEVSVYGMNETTCTAVSRRTSTYDTCRRGIALLRERHVDFVVKGVLLPATTGELAAFDAWSAELVRTAAPPPVVVLLQCRGRRDDAERNRTIVSLRLPASRIVAALSRARERYLTEMRGFCARFLGPHGDTLFACSAGLDAAVDPYGFVQPCLTLRHPECVYDLRRGSLREALAEFFPTLRARRATNPHYLQRCARCFLKGLCEQCPGRSWSEHGTLDTPVEHLCEVAHEQARDLGLVRAGESAWEVASWRARLERLAKNASDGLQAANRNC